MMMANYHGMYRSNEVLIDDADTVRRDVLDDEVVPENGCPEDSVPRFLIDGDVHLEDNGDGADTLWLGSTSTTFSVWAGDASVELTEEFLEALAEHINEPLVIRSVGHTGLRHIPDAYQFRVTPDGDVSRESLEE